MSADMRHDIRICARGNMPLAIAGLCVLLFLIPFSTAGIPGDSIFDISVTHLQMKFRFMADDFVPVVQAFAVLFGFVLGIGSFRFVLDRGQAQTFFSLGLSRKALYLNRVLSGSVLLVAAIFIPMLVSLLLNLISLGLYPGIIAAFIYIFFGLFVTALISFLIASLGCLLAGTMGEAIFFSAAILAIPYAVSYAANAFLRNLLWGNPFGVMPYLGSEQVAPSIMDMLSSFNPVLFFYDDMALHRMFYRPLATEIPPQISPGVLLVWIVVCIVVASIGLSLIGKRRTEQAGFAGKRKNVTRFCAYIPLLFVSALAFDIAAGVNIIFGVILLVAIFALGLFGGDRLLLGSEVESISSRRITSWVVRIAVIAIFAIGAKAGYGAYISLPGEGDVQSVSVNYVGSPNYIGVSVLGSSNSKEYYVSAKYDYTEAKDIALAMQIHSVVSNGGKHPFELDHDNFENTAVPYDVSFTYTLKGGGSKTYYYDRATFAQLRSMLVFDETAPAVSGRSVVLGSVDGYSSQGETLWTRNAYMMGDVYLAEASFRQRYLLSLSSDFRTELLSCIREDVSAQSVQERYFPSKEPIGILMFTMNGENDVNSFAYHLNNAFVYVDEGFVNTLAFLRSNGLWFDSEDEPLGSPSIDEVDTLVIQHYDPYIGINKPKFPQSPYFMSYFSNSVDDFRIQKDFGNLDIVRDPEKLATVLAEMRSSYYLSEPGCLVAIRYVGQDVWVYKFWPGDHMEDMSEMQH